MQGQDILAVRTEFARKMICNQIKKVLKEKAGYLVDIQFDQLEIISANENVSLHLTGTAETDSKELKRICGNSVVLKNIVSMLLNVSWAFLDRRVEKFITEKLKSRYGAQVILQIKDRKYREERGRSSIYLDVDAEIKTTELEKILKAVELIE
ncbi:MAG: hypothetical protein NC121_06030 [Blautia sp.]|nr:hypothetical protein [Blautia sp.]